MRRLRSSLLIAVATVATCAVGIASAATIAPQWSRTVPGSAAVTGPGPTYDPVPFTGTAIVVPFAGQTYSYSNSYGPLAVIPGSTTLPGQSGAGFTFFDNYVFSVGDATAASSTTTIRLGTNFGIEELQARLYPLLSASPNFYYGSVPGGPAYDAWVTVLGTAQIAVIDDVSLPAGLWTLEIRGRTLAAGGSYGGNVNFAAVPLPAAGWLLLSACGSLVLVARRRRIPAA